MHTFTHMFPMNINTQTCDKNVSHAYVIFMAVLKDIIMLQYLHMFMHAYVCAYVSRYVVSIYSV